MKHGDFIKIDFIGRIVGTNQIFDFTQEEVAKREKLHNPKNQYAPALVVIGANMVIPGVEKQLMEMKPGDEKEFTVSPDKAFGPRNPKLVKLFPVSAFLKKNINPNPGAFVEIEGLRGKIQSSSGGRVRVDFNHPLAGKELKYWLRVVKAITDTGEKVKELFIYYGLDETPKVEGAVLTVISEKKIVPELKKFIEESTGKWLKEIKEIKFSEGEQPKEKTKT